MAKKLKKKIKKNALQIPREIKLNISSETKKSIWGIVFLVLAALIILSYFNLAGIFGGYLYKFLHLSLGVGFFLMPILLIIASVVFFKSLKANIYFSTIFGILLFLISVLGFIEVLSTRESFLNLSQAGGYLGIIAAYPIQYIFGFWASLVIFIGLFLISILITFNISFKNLFKRQEKNDEEGLDKEVFGDMSIEDAVREEDIKIEEPTLVNLAKQKLLKRKKNTDIENKSFIEEKDTIIQTSKFFKKATYKLPDIEFLEKDKDKPSSGDINIFSNIIKRSLADFDIEVEMDEVNVGPTVTQYTLKPAQGTKLSRITALQNELALALAAHPIRIEAPIPGKSLVGIEVPNKVVALVRLRNLIERPEFQDSSSLLYFPLGRDVAGNPVYADLEKMPHLLIAGSTGSGKSICLHSIIISFLYRNYPEILKFLIIDPKRVELAIYNGIPHLISPVITEKEKAISALRWAVKEMERRYEALSNFGARDINSYNSKIVKESREELMPYLIIIIDELADLMVAYPREVEGAIVRLAQIARAVGIHLIISTQRPSVEVITGLIKANITARIAFQVASQVDSRTILDMSGAEKLLGHGDMLYLAPEAAKPKRIQGSFVSEKEIKKVVNYLRSVQGIYNLQNLEEEISDFNFKEDSEINFNKTEFLEDDLFNEAKDVVVKAQKASASLLQRRLRVGYARAARLLDMLEERGIVGPQDGAKPRKVLLKDEKDINYQQDD